MRVLSTIAVMVLAEQYAINVKDAEDLLAGIIFGLIQKDDMKYIETCMTDSAHVEQEVNDAVQDFMKGDVESIIRGVEIVGTLLTELPVDLKDCQEMQGDITRISTWINGIISDPVKLVETLTTNLIKNFAKIQTEINTTSADIAKADYYTAGEDISDIVVLTLGKIPAEDMTLY